MLLNLLLITNTVVPILCIIGFCHSKKGFQIDHVFVISAGYLYYWMMPLFTYHYGFLETLNFNEKELLYSNCRGRFDVAGHRCSGS